ncbi:hypothetical protein EDD18DRAFT_809504 [Armillaria luteobubalina]|uniref:Uncharacterized protein n=1 Tax=Armillaria luteobubalina TaxID=153913 RepID=A0AA39QDA7_9AGAR|nr:hypothetical protein EDD18DRAFT_809504 [Armillaria luteobubalina]
MLGAPWFNRMLYFVPLTLKARSTHANEGITFAALLSQHQITPDSTNSGYQELLDQAIETAMAGIRIKLLFEKKLYDRFTYKSFLFVIDESTSKISGVTIEAPTVDARNVKNIKNSVKMTQVLVRNILRQCKPSEG